jgi:mannose-1-phosphate guanylyltransferase
MSICAVIMAGGSGTRLWPLSRAAHAKQFLNLYGEDTMLQATIKRLSGLDIQASITICNEDLRFFVADQLRELDKLGSIILEPVGRNTAPAIALAALTAKDDPLLLVLAADHVIQDETAFNEAVLRAIPLAEEGKLVTFGVVPTNPHTGFGYIKRGKRLGEGFEVDAFVEKPKTDVAEDYLRSGDYYWNSGMFLFRASSYLEELKKFRPDILDQCRASVMGAKADLDFLRIDKEIFELCPDESVDYAVMENTAQAVVMPMDAGWSDVGTWSSLWDISEKDSKGNSTHGDVILHNTNNCYVRTDNELVAVIGVDDLVVVSTKDAILVASKENVQDVKAIVQRLKEESRTEW